MPKNVFKKEKYFFVIDSNSLKDVTDKLYGFTIDATGIYEDEDVRDNFPDSFSGTGTYTAVKRLENEVRIYQDYNGSFGLYLYRDDNYFAVSNSFMLLLEHLKGKDVKLTLNKKFCLHLFRDICSFSNSETVVNEIRTVRKDCILHIDIATQEMREELIDYHDQAISPDSPEALKVLDNWYEKWTGVFRALAQKTGNITVHLSGGFDSRLTFLLMLTSGADLNKIRVFSRQDKLHTHSEDYEIASRIAEDFGFPLNGGNIPTDGLNCTLEDMQAISFYPKMFFHNQLAYRPRIMAEKRFIVGGGGGENIREYWDFTPKEFIDWLCNPMKDFSVALCEEMSDAMCTTIQHTFDFISEKYHITDPNSKDYARICYKEGRSSNHFGKYIVEDMLTNSFSLSPLLDKEIGMLKLGTAECKDNNLLIAMIYERYCPELLNYPFNAGRTIDPVTRALAKKISDRYPYVKKTNNPDFYVGRIRVIDKEEVAACDNPALKPEKGIEYMSSVFATNRIRSLFDLNFSDELYRYAKKYMETSKFKPEAKANIVVALALLNSYLEAGENTLIDSLKEYEASSYQPDVFDKLALLDEIKEYFTARFDIKMPGADKGIVFESSTDREVSVKMPSWFQKEGVGYVLESSSRKAQFVFRCNSDGNVQIKLKGIFKKDSEGNFVHRWVYYDRVVVNGVVKATDVTAWHNSPHVINAKATKGQLFIIEAEWGIADFSRFEDPEG